MIPKAQRVGVVRRGFVVESSPGICALHVQPLEDREMESRICILSIRLAQPMVEAEASRGARRVRLPVRELSAECASCAPSFNTACISLPYWRPGTSRGESWTGHHGILLRLTSLQLFLHSFPRPFATPPSLLPTRALLHNQPIPRVRQASFRVLLLHII